MEKNRFTQEQWTAIWALVGGMASHNDAITGIPVADLKVMLTEAVQVVIGLEQTIGSELLHWSDGDDDYVVGFDGSWFWR